MSQGWLDYEVKIVGEIDDELNEVSEDDYDEIYEVREQRGWWVTMSWMRIVKSVKLMSDDDDWWAG